MIETALYHFKTGTIRFGKEELLEQWSKAKDESWLWLNLRDEAPESEKDLLEKQFHIHPLAITDIQSPRHLPKFEEFKQHTILLLRDLADNAQSEGRPTQVALVIAQNLIITRSTPVTSEPVKHIWNRLQANDFSASKGVFHVAYLIIRQTSRRYTDTLLQLEATIEDYEDQVITNPNDQLLASLIIENRRLKKIRRDLTYHYSSMTDLQQHHLQSEQKIDPHEINDLIEQFDRLRSMAQLQEELVSDMTNTYISLTAHRLNQIMKVLTIATVILLPLSIIAGIYGMNFEHMPELHWRYGYFGALGLMSCIVVTLLILLRKARWL